VRLIAASLFMFSLFSSIPVHAGRLCAPVVALLSGEAAAALRIEVRAHEAKVATAQHRLAAANAERDSKLVSAQSAQAVLDAQWQSMNLRERYLGGWFWADRSKAAEYSQLFLAHRQALEVSRSKERAAKKAQKEFDVADFKVRKAIGLWLEKNDTTFKELRQLLQKLKALVRCGSSCLNQIDIAIAEVDDATEWETLDAITSTSGTSILSYLEMEEAQEEIHELRRLVDNYRAQLAAFQKQVGTLRELHVDDKFDLSIDLAFDFGFDFMSWFNVFKLEEASETLQEFREEIQAVHSRFDADAKSLRLEIKAIVCEARGICETTP
jgi:hypothetical protein